MIFDFSARPRCVRSTDFLSTITPAAFAGGATTRRSDTVRATSVMRGAACSGVLPAVRAGGAAISGLTLDDA